MWYLERLTGCRPCVCIYECSLFCVYYYNYIRKLFSLHAQVHGTKMITHTTKKQRYCKLFLYSIVIMYMLEKHRTQTHSSICKKIYHLRIH